MVDSHPTDFIKTQAVEAVKQFIVYDGSNRMSEVYTAPANARDGEAALKTEYTYVGASARVEKMQESASTWDETWDI